MKGKLHEHTVGIIVGAFVGLMHLVWSTIVALGFAQGLIDWIFGLHFLENPYVVSSFDMTKAATLVIVTSLVGYFMGWVFATIWNMVAKK